MISRVGAHDAVMRVSGREQPSRSDLEFYDVVSHDWKAEPGTFTVYVGSSSRDIRQVGKFALTF